MFGESIMNHFAQTMRSFRNKWRRALLSSSGVMIATLCLVIINHLSIMFQHSINEQFNSNSGFAISISLNSFNSEDPLPDPHEIMELASKNQHIVFLEPFFEQNITINKQHFSIYGVTPNYTTILNTQTITGRPLHKNDNYPYIVLSEKLYENLSSQNMTPNVGYQMIIDQSAVEIIGTCTEFEPFIFMYPPKNGAAFISTSTFKQLYGTTNINRYIMIIDDLKHAELITNLIDDHLKKTYPKLRISMYNPKRMMEISSQTQGIFSLFAYILALICAFLGGIGIMNMSIAEVSERRSEIALRIAFGATPKNIRKMLCTESTLLCLISAIIGIIFGLIIIKILAHYMSKTFILNIQCIIYSILFACTVGILSNLYPAKLIQKIPVAYILKGE